MKSIKQREQDQINYVEGLKKDPKKNLLAATINQIISMRSSGYSSTAYAIGDLVDNSIEAGASKIAINFDKSLKKLFIIDNGMGMQPELISHAMTYGGTHRHGSEEMIGKFGMGAANATNSIASETSFMSKKKGADFHSCNFSFEKLKNGDYNVDNNIEIPVATPWKLSGKAKELIDTHFKSFDCGTIIEMNLDVERLSHKTQRGLQNHLLNVLSVLCCNFLGNNKILINDVICNPVNPLFADPNAALYQVEGITPEDLHTVQTISIKNKVTGKQGDVRVTFNYLGKDFCPEERREGVPEMRARWSIMKDWQGFIMSRNGRFLNAITRIKKSDWDTMPSKLKSVFQNNDRYVRIGIDFDASLDEDFGVEFNKQYALPDSRVWDAIHQQTNIWSEWTIAAKKYDQAKKAEEEKNSSAEVANESGLRPSEVALTTASEYENPNTIEESERVVDLGAERLKQEVAKLAREAGEDITDPEVIAKHENAITGSNKQKSFSVSHANQPDGAHFFSIDVIGSTIKVIINTNHRFYNDVYMNGNWSSAFMRNAFEILLGSIGERWHLTDDNEDFYKREVGYWSIRLENSLKKLMDEMKNSKPTAKAK